MATQSPPVVTEFPFVFKAGDETLSAIGVAQSPTNEYDIISLHGAGESTKERQLYLLKEICAATLRSTLSFDFSGHGKSTGSLAKSSLQKETFEALVAFRQYATRKAVLFGSSMGAHVALSLLTQCELRTLVLFCPAIYSKESVSVPFGPQFSNVIRRHESWRDTDILAPLRNYTGRLLIFMGEEDRVIPRGVIELLDENSVSVERKKIVWIPQCPHAIHVFLPSHDKARELVVSEILSFL